MKQHLIWCMLLTVGVLSFCFFNFPYISTHSGDFSSSVDGYGVLGKWADGAFGGICAFLQLIVWGISLTAVTFAFAKILAEILGKPVKETVFGISVKGLGELLLLIHGIFSFALLVFAIIHTVNISGYGVQYAVNIGLILSVTLSVVLNICYFINREKN